MVSAPGQCLRINAAASGGTSGQRLSSIAGPSTSTEIALPSRPLSARSRARASSSSASTPRP